MKNLEKLVNLLIEGLPAPTEIRDGSKEKFEEDRTYYYNVLWSNTSQYPGIVDGGQGFFINGPIWSVSLEACEHRILLTASLYRGGACAAELMFYYAPSRLKGLLAWMQNKEPFENLYKMNKYAWFHNKFNDDPPITEHMYGGRLNDMIWKQLN